MATLEASPAVSAALSDSPNAKKIAVVQNAAAGTSLIGDTSIASTAGLVASSHAAPRPIHGDPSLRPIANVIQTSSAPVSGVTQNIGRRLREDAGRKQRQQGQDDGRGAGGRSAAARVENDHVARRLSRALALALCTRACACSRRGLHRRRLPSRNFAQGPQ